MISERVVDIEAPAPVVWAVFSDVERWPEWTPSIRRVTPLDGQGLAVGRRFEVRQPWFPTVAWEVSDLTEGASWTWRQHTPGSTARATHEVMPQGPDRTRVRLLVDQRGPLGVVVALLSRRLTRRYLELEASGLKVRSEQAADAPPA
jgi:uncharacterized membrane protein